MNLIIKAINLTVIFILEMAMLVSFGYFAMSRPWNLPLRLLLGTVILAIAIALWAYFGAPKSAHRLTMPYLAIFRSIMFLVAAFLLLLSGQKNAAIIFAALAIVTQFISLFTENQ